MYLALKHIHLTTIAITILLFLLRGFWMMIESGQLQKKWCKIVPHINDTLLLVSAIGLMMTLQQYPFVHHWLTAKLLGLIAYIVLGTIALKRGKTKSVRIIAFFASLAVLGYIAGVAINHNPMSWLS